MDMWTSMSIECRIYAEIYFSASKIAWILEHVEGARQKAEAGELIFGTVDSWLIWNLTKGAVHVTDYTNASRTMLFNIHEVCWDEELLELFNIPRSMLPEVKPSGYVYGKTDAGILGGEIPIAGAAGDAVRAMLFYAGSGKEHIWNGLFPANAYGRSGNYFRKRTTDYDSCGTSEKVEYALEGSVFVAGAAVQWLRDSMRMIRNSGQSEVYAKKVSDTNGVYVVPTFAGMEAPYWNPYAMGTIVGITRGCEKEHFIRAALESVAYQTIDVLKAMQEDAGVPMHELKVDGGASANEFLMQFQADIAGHSVYRPSCIETTALGAAYLAGLAIGYWKDKEEICANWKLDKRFDAAMEDERRTELLKGWKKAVKCALV